MRDHTLPSPGPKAGVSLALLAALTLLLSACDHVGEQAGKAVEQRVQQEASKLVDQAIGTVDKTLDKTLDAVTNRRPTGAAPVLKADPSLQAAGLAATRLHLKPGPAATLSVYLTFEKAGTSSLEVRFHDREGAEIGRHRQRVRAEAGDGRFVDFPVDPRVPVEEIRSVSIRRL